MPYDDLTSAQKAFLKKYLSIDETNFVEENTSKIPVLPGDDPLGAFLAESQGRLTGDKGAEVRDAARSGRQEIDKLMRDQERERALKRQRILASGSGLTTGLQNRETILDEAQSAATEGFDDIIDEGYKLSVAFKEADGAVDQDDDAEKLLKKVDTVRDTAIGAINKAMGDLEMLAVEADKLTAADRATFGQRAKEAQDSVSALLRWEHPKAADLDKRLKTVSMQAQSNYRAAIPTVTTIGEEAESAKKDAAETYDMALKNLLGQIAEAKKAAKNLELSFEQRRLFLSKDEKALTTDKLDAALDMANSGKNQNGLRAALKLAQEARIAIDEIEKSRLPTPPVNQGDAPGPSVVSQIDTIRKSIKSVLNSDKNSKRRPTDKVKMQELFDKLVATEGSMTPPLFLVKLKEVETKIVGPGGQNWTSYAGRCETQLSYDKTAEARLELLEKRIPALDKLLAKGETYKGSLIPDIKRARDMLKIEEPQTMRDDIDKLIESIGERLKAYEDMGGMDSVTTDPIKLKAREVFLEDQVAGVTAETKLNEAKAEYEKEYKALTLRIKEFAKDPILSDSRRKGEYTELEQQAKSTETLVKEATDYAPAMEVLRRASARLERLKQSGEALTGKTLVKAGTKWRGAIGNFRTNLDKLATTVGKAVEEEVKINEERRKQLADILLRISEQKAYFRENIFDAPIKDLVESKDTAVRKRAREVALRDIGLYLDYLRSNTTIKAIVNNPFGVTGIASVLFSELRDIEFEVLRTA